MTVHEIFIMVFFLRGGGMNIISSLSRRRGMHKWLNNPQEVKQSWGCTKFLPTNPLALFPIIIPIINPQ